MQFHARGGWSEPFPPLDSGRTLIVVFGAPEYLEDRRPWRELRAAYPRSLLLGCSTAGEIRGAAIHDRSLVVAIAAFERTELRTSVAPVRHADESRAAGASIARTLAGPGLQGLLVLSEGVGVNASELVRGIQEEAEGAVVFGGLAADGDRFRRTWVATGDGPVTGCVAAVGFYGDGVRLNHGCRGGWDIFGPERTVTRSCGNVLYELDFRPALALYKQYLGERAAGLPATALLFPLAIRETTGAEPRVRTILGVDHERESLTFAGDIPTGALAQLMRANFDRLIDGAANAAAAAASASCGTESLTLAISCVGRRLVLGQRAEEEIEAVVHAFDAASAAATLGRGRTSLREEVARHLSNRTAMIGFYSYGEISPFAAGSCELHNQTMTLTRIWEA